MTLSSDTEAGSMTKGVKRKVYVCESHKDNKNERGKRC